MRNHEQHVSDEELLLAEDGELGKRADRVRTHLEGCLQCRSRAAEMEKTLQELAWAESSSVAAELSAIDRPRALLRTRLAELSTGRASLFDRHRSSGFVAGAVGVAALAAVMVFAAVLGVRQFTATSGAFSFMAPNRGVLPNPALTPGAARQSSLEQVCSLSREEVIKPVSTAEREKVFAEYGISNAHSDQYEVDYLITPGLGGYDDIRNLWPEPYQHSRWNAHMKDALEERLHEMVCSREIDLSVAQEAIATNWIAAYQKYVQTAPSHARAVRAPFLAQTATVIPQVKP